MSLHPEEETSSLQTSFQTPGDSSAAWLQSTSNNSQRLSQKEPFEFTPGALFDPEETLKSRTFPQIDSACRAGNDFGSSQTLSTSEKKSCHFSSNSQSCNSPPCHPNPNAQISQRCSDNEVKRYWEFLDKCAQNKRPNCPDPLKVEHEWNQLIKVRCGDPKLANSYCPGEFETEAEDASYGMPDCPRCKYLHCKCGLCRQCRIYSYVGTVSNYQSQGQLEKNKVTLQKRFKAKHPSPILSSSALARKKYDLALRRARGSDESGSFKNSSKLEVIGGPLITEYRAQFRIYSKKGSSSSKKGSEEVGGGGPVEPGKPRPSWNSSIKVNPTQYELTLSAAEAKLRELDRMLEDDPTLDLSQVESKQQTKTVSKEQTSREKDASKTKPKAKGKVSESELEDNSSDYTSDMYTATSYSTSTKQTVRSQQKVKGQGERSKPVQKSVSPAPNRNVAPAKPAAAQQKNAGAGPGAKTSNKMLQKVTTKQAVNKTADKDPKKESNGMLKKVTMKEVTKSKATEKKAKKESNGMLKKVTTKEVTKKKTSEKEAKKPNKMLKVVKTKTVKSKKTLSSGDDEESSEEEDESGTFDLANTF